MTDLGDLPGGNDFSIAYDINEDGQVVGYSRAATGARGVLWDSGTMTDLGDLPGGTDSSVAYGINEAGQVVGYGQVVAGTSAFLWEAGTGMRALDDLIDPASGWSIFDARAINDAGQIAATGSFEGGYRQAVLLTPVAAVPLPAGLPLLLAGLGGLALLRRGRRTQS